MGAFRSYLSKNDTLIEGNYTNNSQNPVSEISYGSLYGEVTRLIFDLDLTSLVDRINDGFINPDTITKHTLYLTNTISNAPEYIGKRSYSLDLERASSFQLEVFNVSEDWDEGSGYDFVWNNQPFLSAGENVNENPVNWYYRKTNTLWGVSGGSYQSGVTQIFGTQEFEDGSEDLEIDITDYVNGRLNASGVTGVTGYTGTSYGLGVKFLDEYEALNTLNKQVVGFHVKDTHTFYEPYIKTEYDDSIIDDRNYFYQNKDNYLYLYPNVANFPQNITIEKVEIYDYNGDLYSTITGDSIVNVKKGVYKIPLNVDSDMYPDSVMFYDKWYLTINNVSKTFTNEFYLISDDKYYDFDLSNEIEFDNYMFYFYGIRENEKINSGNIRKIKLNVKELYSNQNNFIPLEIEYRLFTLVDGKHELEVIPFTSVNRTSKGYNIDLDTYWLIPQDYILQLRMKNGTYYENKESIRFTVVSNEIK